MDASLRVSPLDSELRPAQKLRLSAWNLSKAVDIHCHCLPGIDDGPSTMADALLLCSALADDGLTTIVASPHQLGPYDRTNSARVVREAVITLNQELIHNNIPLEILPGADIRIDERLLWLLAADEIMTIADRGKHLLLELPFHQYVDPLPLISELKSRGVTTIMTHPERHSYLKGALRIMRSWRESGALIQVTAGSLLGQFGLTAESMGWQLVQENMVDVIATDSHDHINRGPTMTQAIEVLTHEIGKPQAIEMCLQNPWKIVQGEQL